MDENQKISLLIVDDDAIYLDVLKELLRDTYTIHTAQTGEAAVELAQNLNPDLILLDVVIPGKTGYEVFADLRENEMTRRIPVIFISGLTDMDEMEKGFLLGAADYVQKPCSKVVLYAKINTHLKVVEYAQTINQIGMLDPLTGLPMRKRFMYRVNEEWRRNCRTQTPISLLYVDIDNLKEFNQEYGYMAGDTLVKSAGGLCREITRRSADTVAAFGKGLFALLLAGTDAQGAWKIAQVILENARNHNIRLLNSDKPAKFTVSIGISVFTPTKADLSGDIEKKIENFTDTAFQKLQEAKAAGKNQIAS